MIEEPRAIRLTRDQLDLLAAIEVADASHLYNSLIHYELEGRIDPAVLEARWNALLDRAPAMSMRVAAGVAGPELIPSSRRAPFVLSDRSAGPALHDVDRRMAVEAARPLDIRRGPLARLILIRESETRARLLVVISHLIADEVSGQLVARGLLEGVMPMATPPVVVDDPIAPTAPSAPSSPRGGPPPATTGALGADHRGRLGDQEPMEASADVDAIVEDASAPIAAFASIGVTTSSATLAALGWVLSRRMRQPRVGVSTSMSLRRSDQSGHIDYMQRSVGVEIDVDESATAADHLRRVHSAAVATYRRERQAGPSSGSPTRVAYPFVLVQRDALRSYRDEGFRATPRDEPDPGVAQFDVVIYAARVDDDLRLKLRYRRRALGEAEAGQIARQLVHALHALAENPDARLESLTSLTPDEEEELIQLGRGDHEDRPAWSIPERVEQWVRSRPEASAVIAGERHLTYSGLWREAAASAAELRVAGVMPGDRVGICVDRSASSASAMLAVMLTGAAYVPIDPDYPDERISFIIRDAGLSFALVDSARLAGSSLTTVDLRSASDGPRAHGDWARPAPDDVAYVIYTSGSTGVPKGVQVRHGNVAALVAGTERLFDLRPEDRWSVLHNFAFDYAVWEIWGALLTGATAIIADKATVRSPDDLLLFLETSGVTILSLTPSGSSLLAQAKAFATADLSVRLVVFGGEALTAATLRPWHDRVGSSEPWLVNMYGITETTVHCTWRRLDRAARALGAGIGQPLPGWEVHVLDERRRPAPLGAVGEIWVGGNGVSAGYLNRPALDAERFQTVALGSREVLLYRSGDLARRTSDHDIEYLGRMDDQVEIGGHRVEPGEVVHCMQECEGVTVAAVIPRVAADVVVGLSAFFVGSAEDARVRRHVRERMPAHMVPLTFRKLDDMPRTANGKLDVRMLRELQSPRGAEGGVVPRSRPQEARTRSDPPDSFLSAWRDLLGGPVGVDDNFFDLGGNSLLALQLASALSNGGFPVRARDVLRSRTPRALWMASREGAPA